MNYWKADYPQKIGPTNFTVTEIVKDFLGYKVIQYLCILYTVSEL